MQVGQDVFDSKADYAESTVLRIASDLVSVEGSRAQTLVTNAQEIGYVPESKISLDWGKAQVHEYDKQSLVSVPFKGREDLEIVNRVVFFFEGDEIRVSEIYMTILDEYTFRIRHWMDSELILDRIGTRDQAAEESSAEGEIAVQNVGMNWKVLDRCLSNQGVGSWALAGISLVCGGVCAATAGLGCPACIAFATGFGGAFVEKCVRQAWV
ncbi:hypothetical protein [Trueperella pecoris]|uniref:hypothetical protein n=1 Tax=Trueperella pecoris TaxID=2733571 RepID=UPI001ABE34D3|nr:hypothetical protein [Trueperella pecoris]QTG74993.1 hypothetical protein J4179_07105 [Trueperella pecoris]